MRVTAVVNFLQLCWKMLISNLIVCLVATSVHGKASWSDPVAACIWGHNVEVVNDVTLEECQEKCDSTTSFDCRSVEIVGSGVGGTGLFAETCWMSNVTSLDTSDFRKPCSGIFSNVLFSEKLGNAAPTEYSTTNSGTGETDWTCEFCTKASSALTSHSTSTANLEDELALIVTHVCPVWSDHIHHIPGSSDPASCKTYLPTFWPIYGKLMWSGFWSLVCADQDCPWELPGSVKDVLGLVRTLSSPPSCQSCRSKINAHLDSFDGPIAVDKFKEGLHKFCVDSQEDTEECNLIGKFLIPGATNLLKLRSRDWIIDFCQQKLECKKDD